MIYLTPDQDRAVGSSSDLISISYNHPHAHQYGTLVEIGLAKVTSNPWGTHSIDAAGRKTVVLFPLLGA